MLRSKLSRRPLAAAFTALLLAVATTSCASDEAPLPAPSSHDAGEANVFEGTAEEYTLLVRACLEEQGIQTQDLTDSNDQTGYSVSIIDHTPEQVAEISEGCRAEIGEPQTSGLTETQLQERYDARLEQWQCLVGHGLV